MGLEQRTHGIGKEREYYDENRKGVTVLFVFIVHLLRPGGE